jgi:hypothetical protein
MAFNLLQPFLKFSHFRRGELEHGISPLYINAARKPLREHLGTSIGS